MVGKLGASFHTYSVTACSKLDLCLFWKRTGYFSLLGCGLRIAAAAIFVASLSSESLKTEIRVQAQAYHSATSPTITDRPISNTAFVSRQSGLFIASVFATLLFPVHAAAQSSSHVALELHGAGPRPSPTIRRTRTASLEASIEQTRRWSTSVSACARREPERGNGEGSDIGEW